MKIGALVCQPEPVNGFDLTAYYIKGCTGKINKPADGMYNIISCFGDNRTARKRPEWVAVSQAGKAVRTNKSHRFLWDIICPSVKEYKLQILDLINEALKAEVTGIHLESIGFPRAEYCTCDRCVKEHKESNVEWVEWRAKTVTDFIAKASKLVKENGKGFSVTLLPDPCFGKQRYGEDFVSMAKHVDFFLVPIYDLAYSTTYWLENLAYDFSKQLEKPLYIELYATPPGPKLKNLLKAIVSVADYADGVILATHDTCVTKKIQEKILTNSELTSFLQRHECEPVTGIIKKWKSCQE